MDAAATNKDAPSSSTSRCCTDVATRARIGRQSTVANKHYITRHASRLSRLAAAEQHKDAMMRSLRPSKPTRIGAALWGASSVHVEDGVRQTLGIMMRLTVDLRRQNLPNPRSTQMCMAVKSSHRFSLRRKFCSGCDYPIHGSCRRPCRHAHRLPRSQ